LERKEFEELIDRAYQKIPEKFKQNPHSIYKCNTVDKKINGFHRFR